LPLSEQIGVHQVNHLGDDLLVVGGELVVFPALPFDIQNLTMKLSKHLTFLLYTSCCTQRCMGFFV
jgi:hypothetical protein